MFTPRAVLNENTPGVQLGLNPQRQFNWGVLVRRNYGGFNWDLTNLHSMRTSGNELFHAPYNAAFQTNLDTMRMCGGSRENILDDAFRKYFGSLILFL
jgi:hypothetical protein